MGLHMYSITLYGLAYAIGFVPVIYVDIFFSAKCDMFEITVSLCEQSLNASQLSKSFTASHQTNFKLVTLLHLDFSKKCNSVTPYNFSNSVTALHLTCYRALQFTNLKNC